MGRRPWGSLGRSPGHPPAMATATASGGPRRERAVAGPPTAASGDSQRAGRTGAQGRLGQPGTMRVSGRPGQERHRRNRRVRYPSTETARTASIDSSARLPSSKRPSRTDRDGSVQAIKSGNRITPILGPATARPPRPHISRRRYPVVGEPTLSRRREVAGLPSRDAPQRHVS